MKNPLPAFLAACFLLLPATRALPAEGGRVKIVLVGDSTVTDNAGWGLGFKQFLTDGAECINTAQGGRSSESFRREGRWTRALELKGAYYLVQFGHNNEPGKPGRSTDMPTFVRDMTSYVDEARAAGVKPVLVTPLTRRQWDKEHPGKIKSSLEPYAREVRKIAAEKHVPLVDLHARSIALCEQLGPEKCLAFSPHMGGEAYDGTHLNHQGYVLFARLVVEELRKAVPELAPLLSSNPADAHPVARESKYDAIVSADGSGTHTTVREAVAAAPEHSARPFVILVKPGTYEGQLIIPRKARNVRLVGEEAEGTVLTYALNVNETAAQTDLSCKGTGVMVWAEGFSAENITFQNTSGDHGQALALRVDGDRAVFRHCRFLGWQDTLMVNNGRDYFDRCYIEGRVDFIYGSATAVFDHCEIHSKNGGCITAASTPKEKPHGLVFLDCKLTGDPAPWAGAPAEPVKPGNAPKAPLARLGRPWRPFGSVAFIRCDMGGHIKPEGWDNWGKPGNERSCRYTEYQSTGPGAAPASRAPWSRQLTDEEAKGLTVKAVLGGADHWQP